MWTAKHDVTHITLVALGSFALATSASGQVGTYEVNDLSVAIPEAPSSDAWAINESGEVAGVIRDSFGFPLEVVLFTGGQVETSPADNRIVQAIDGEGTIVGTRTGFQLAWALVQGEYICIPTPEWCLPAYLYADKRALAANEQGVITGTISPEAEPGAWPPVLPGSELYTAFIDDAGTPQLQRLGMFDDQVTIGRAINNAGTIVGTYGFSPADEPFLYRDGTFHPLPTLGQPYNWPNAINEVDQAAGFVSLNPSPGPIATTGAVWNVANVDNITVETIGQFEGSTSTSLTDINSSGLAVGRAVQVDGSIQLWEKPIVWTAESGIFNANELLAEGSGWTIHTVSAINDAGEIAATATFNGSSPRAVRLDPVESSAKLGDMTGNGSVGGADLLMLLSAWGACHGHCPADLNSDGVVDGIDLMILLNNWG